MKTIKKIIDFLRGIFSTSKATNFEAEHYIDSNVEEIELTPLVVQPPIQEEESKLSAIEIHVPETAEKAPESIVEMEVAKVEPLTNKEKIILSYMRQLVEKGILVNTNMNKKIEFDRSEDGSYSYVLWVAVDKTTLPKYSRVKFKQIEYRSSVDPSEFAKVLFVNNFQIEATGETEMVWRSSTEIGRWYLNEIGDKRSRKKTSAYASKAMKSLVKKGYVIQNAQSLYRAN